jgi:CheY-like chemotaxis protein
MPLTDGSSVLLVDPSIDERDMYAEYFRMRGFTTLQTDNAEDAYRLATELRPAAIVTVIALLRGDDGLALTRRLKASAAVGMTPVLILTGYVRDTDLRDADAAGCDRFVTKPCAPEVLADAVQALLIPSA